MQLSINEKLACLYECVIRIGQINEEYFIHQYFGICRIMEKIICEIMRKKDPYFSPSSYSSWLVDIVFENFQNYRPNTAGYAVYWFPITEQGMSDRILVLLAMADELEDQKLH